MVTDASAVLVEREDATVWITLNRPDRLNAITPAMADDLLAVFTALADDEAARVVILRGSGRAFCGGLDIKETLASMGQWDIDAQDDSEPSVLARIILAIRRCPQPVVALVHGAACGGGFAFALAADVRIAGESARMNDAFVNLGVSGCELGVSYFLPRYIGLSAASELMYTGRFIHADRAHELGLVSTVVPDEELEQAGRDLAAEMLRVAPLALRKTKETLAKSIGMTDLEKVLALEEATQLECMRGPLFEEGLRAFVEKRDPQFTADPGT
ncbi:enoyl-CoA hydratase-related protein [Nocardioides sp. LHD-245]|uniref:enoyl-CoA hydratase/isomerase family protein n=1 Tax=Nocardioides sp. LHD-245 TaxID=3051387 RepID=UPI0027E16BDE|nr:enoyl-CoA hydratase-related protein [Nocardioides sp. LHD-245]